MNNTKRKFKNILCLDIDDAVYSGTDFFDGVDDTHDVLELNMKRIKTFLDRYDMGVFITSAWYPRLEIVDHNLKFTDLKLQYVNDYDLRAGNIIFEHTKGRAYGLSCGRRQEDIATLLNNGHVVVAMDDMDLSKKVIIDTGLIYPPTVSEYYHFAEIKGFFVNEIAYYMHKFLKEHNDD